jgi:integrase
MTPLAAGTIHTFHRVLSAVLFRAVKWGYIQSNPAARADLPSIANRRAAYLDEPDARRLLELLRDEPIKWRAIVTFDLLSGLRRGELAGLRWQDVNSEEQTIIIRQTSNYLPGKGVYVDTPKTSTSNRPLKLSRSAFLLLMEYKRWQDDQRDALGDAWKDKDGRIFTTDDGAPMFPDSITQWFSKFVKRTGLPKVTVHSLRHTYASIMISDGVPLVVVSHQLGHAQTSTTANIYAHVIASAEAKAAQTFDKFNDIVLQEEQEIKKPKKPAKVKKIV